MPPKDRPVSETTRVSLTASTWAAILSAFLVLGAAVVGVLLRVEHRATALEKDVEYLAKTVNQHLANHK